VPVDLGGTVGTTVLQLARHVDSRAAVTGVIMCAVGPIGIEPRSYWLSGGLRGCSATGCFCRSPRICWLTPCLLIYNILRETVRRRSEAHAGQSTCSLLTLAELSPVTSRLKNPATATIVPERRRVSDWRKPRGQTSLQSIASWRQGDGRR